MKYVEFVGLACSGKTALSIRVIDVLRAAGVPVVGGGAVSNVRLLLALLRVPQYAFRWWRVICRHIGNHRVRLRLLRQFCTPMAEVLHWSSRSVVLVLDEGILQGVRSLRRASQTDLTLESILSTQSPEHFFPVVPSTVVLLEIDALTWAQRVRARDQIVVTEAEADDAVARVAHSVRDAETLARRSPATRFDRRRNEDDDDLGGLAEIVARAIGAEWTAALFHA